MKRKFPWSAKKVRRRHYYHFFISHATDDKKDIVQPVAEEMKKLGLSYFLDSSQIKVGASVHRSLSQGLNKSQYFLAFISEKYLQKNWTRLELDAALHRQASQGTSFILPVLIGNKAQRERIIAEIPLLANMLHLMWENNAAKIATSLIEKINQK